MSGVQGRREGGDDVQVACGGQAMKHGCHDCKWAEFDPGDYGVCQYTGPGEPEAAPAMVVVRGLSGESCPCWEEKE